MIRSKRRPRVHVAFTDLCYYAFGVIHMLRILVVEDDPVQRKVEEIILKRNHYEVFTASNAEEALRLLDSVKMNLVILDVMMPGMDGFELTKQLRSYDRHLPILIITGKADFSDKQVGFLSGADDYMVKPVDLEEMLLRISALLRRANIQSEGRISAGSTMLDSSTWKVTTGDRSITLPRRQFEVLFMMLSYPGRLFTRRQLMEAVWGLDCDTDDRTVDVHIKRLREKFRSNPNFEITTIRGMGYRAEVRGDVQRAGGPDRRSRGDSHA